MNKKELKNKLEELINNNRDMVQDHMGNIRRMKDNNAPKEEGDAAKNNPDIFFTRVAYMDFYLSSKTLIMKY